MAKKLELFFPLSPCYISQPFGVNWGADYKKLLGTEGHPGRDMIIRGPTGSNLSYSAPVRASHNGKVLSVETDSRGGIAVVLLTDEPREYNGGETYFKTVYSHLKTNSVEVYEGDYVRVGDVLGLCGATGVTVGEENPNLAHVHFALKPTKLRTDVAIPYWENSEQGNGHGGAIDDAPYFPGMTAEQYVSISNQLKLLATKVAGLFSLLFRK